MYDPRQTYRSHRIRCHATHQAPSQPPRHVFVRHLCQKHPLPVVVVLRVAPRPHAARHRMCGITVRHWPQARQLGATRVAIKPEVDALRLCAHVTRIYSVTLARLT